jgi:hypothetical protein
MGISILLKITKKLIHKKLIWKGQQKLSNSKMNPSTTIVKGIVCNACKNELPPMTMKQHLDGDFNQECPHTPVSNSKMYYQYSTYNHKFTLELVEVKKRGWAKMRVIASAHTHTYGSRHNLTTEITFYDTSNPSCTIGKVFSAKYDKQSKNYWIKRFFDAPDAVPLEEVETVGRFTA